MTYETHTRKKLIIFARCKKFLLTVIYYFLTFVRLQSKRPVSLWKADHIVITIAAFERDDHMETAKRNRWLRLLLAYDVLHYHLSLQYQFLIDFIIGIIKN